jgi:hypothetical protein
MPPLGRGARGERLEPRQGRARHTDGLKPDADRSRITEGTQGRVALHAGDDRDRARGPQPSHGVERAAILEAIDRRLNDDARRETEPLAKRTVASPGLYAASGARAKRAS